MKTEFLQNFPHIILIGVGLILFLTSFLMILYMTFHPGANKIQNEVASLPLENSEGNYEQ